MTSLLLQKRKSSYICGLVGTQGRENSNHHPPHSECPSLHTSESCMDKQQKRRLWREIRMKRKKKVALEKVKR